MPNKAEQFADLNYRATTNRPRFYGKRYHVASPGTVPSLMDTVVAQVSDRGALEVHCYVLRDEIPAFVDWLRDTFTVEEARNGTV